jgi:hypothetical protein
LGYCKSEASHNVGQMIYRTAKQCCDANAPGQDCLFNSKASVAPMSGEMAGMIGVGAKEQFFYPDLYNTENCVYSNKYDEWMAGDGFKEMYLFPDPVPCCSRWYPDRTDCPKLMPAVASAADDEQHYDGLDLMTNQFYYPDNGINNCGFGRDFPMWMGEQGYAQHYLFTDPQDCCDRFFNGKTDCPAENTPQTGYYWERYAPNLVANMQNVDISEVYWTFYPDIPSGTCIRGVDYPKWMNNPGYARKYLFSTADGCCHNWFGPDDGDKFHYCHHNIIYRDPFSTPPTVPNTGSLTTNPALTSGTSWYPIQNSNVCANDGNAPWWMLQTNFQNSFLFTTELDCCAAYGYVCGGNVPATTGMTNSGALWYPGGPDVNNDYTCKNDGHAPLFMVKASTTYLVATQADCCAKWYGTSGSFGYNVCMGTDPTIPTAPSNWGNTVWYPSWVSGGGLTCLNDGNLASYMIINFNANPSEISMTPQECCTHYFAYDGAAYTQCVTNSLNSAQNGAYPTAGTGDWYPLLYTQTCSNNPTTMPAYFNQPGYAPWYKFDSYQACCNVFQC